MVLTPITFGTSGWRAVLADEFTFANAKLVIRAIADELLSGPDAEKAVSQGVLVSHDTRFLGPDFALMAARILSGAGIKPLLTNRDAPTPVIAFEIIRSGLAGGINFTASHNPAIYQGIKFSPSHGGPASKELTKSLERRILDMQLDKTEIYLGEAPKDRTDPREPYKKRIAELVDLESIRKAGLKILVNCLYGTSRDYLDALLRDAGCNALVMNNHLDPSFGGHPPEPAPAYVEDFIARIENGGFDLGLATDGDADRFGIYGTDNVSPNPNEILALLLDHLAVSRGWRGTVVRSVATSHFVDAVAKLHGCSVIEVPVGFKWIAAEMEKAPADFIIGGEESGGLTIRGHVPEKDGILACLLVAEMVAMRGKSIAELLAELKARTGPIASNRINVAYDPNERAELLARVAVKPASLAGRKVVSRNDLDGAKFILDDGSWIMTRFSGTEPVVRLYVEGAPDRLPALEEAGMALLKSPAK